MTYKEFKALLTEWHNNVAMHSNPSIIMDHDNHKKILSAYELEEKKIISYIVLGLLDHTLICMHLLFELIPKEEKPPIDPYYISRIPVLKEMWLYWGLKSKYIKTGYDPFKYWYESYYDSEAKENK